VYAFTDHVHDAVGAWVARDKNALLAQANGAVVPRRAQLTPQWRNVRVAALNVLWEEGMGDVEREGSAEEFRKR